MPNNTLGQCKYELPEHFPLHVHSELLGRDAGHSNQKQKIQYHLRLKQELEELRHEVTVLLREKFHLEQCVRYQVGMVA